MANFNLFQTHPFWLHILVETPAFINFFLNPLDQLSLLSPSPAAESVIRQYAVLLLVSCLIALIFALRPIDLTSQRVAGALSLYHLATIVRAAVRIKAGDNTGGLGGPWVHLEVHTVCFVALQGMYLFSLPELLMPPTPRTPAWKME